MNKSVFNAKKSVSIFMKIWLIIAVSSAAIGFLFKLVSFFMDKPDINDVATLLFTACSYIICSSPFIVALIITAGYLKERRYKAMLLGLALFCVLIISLVIKA